MKAFLIFIVRDRLELILTAIARPTGDAGAAGGLESVRSRQPAGQSRADAVPYLCAGPATQVYGVTRSYDQTGVESTVYEPINAINIGQAITQDTAPDPTLGSFSFSPTGQTELDFTIPSGSTAANQPIFIGGLKGTAQANSISMGVGPSNNVTTLASNFGATVDSNGYITDATSAAPPRAANPPLSYCGVLVWYIQDAVAGNRYGRVSSAIDNPHLSARLSGGECSTCPLLELLVHPKSLYRGRMRVRWAVANRLFPSIQRLERELGDVCG